jgi:hypothetical protein
MTDSRNDEETNRLLRPEWSSATARGIGTETGR